MQKYDINQFSVNTILGWINSNEVAIPEIQRPFVWNSTKVRDLMDSLYKGYPIGYIISWRNPDVRLKDGTTSSGKRVLIDGQQRVMALRAAIAGMTIVNDEYKEVRIVISFNPLTQEFGTLTPAIRKDSAWIADISDFMSKDSGRFSFIREYCDKNPGADRDQIEKNIEKLLEIKNKSVGCIELTNDLDIETVTNIFIRINSQGVKLSSADFAMSKIASYGDFGINLRKLIDYFCHLAREPKFYKQISENDTKFTDTGFLEKIAWLKNVNDDLYDPDYSDVIRVAFSKNFERGKISELVALLSGRDFTTREFKEEIAKESFDKLQSGVLDFVNQTNFERFVMIIKSTGFVSQSLINSQNALNFAYILYLKLLDQKMDSGRIEKFVKKWFVMSNLTARYSGSSESFIDLDIKEIVKNGVEEALTAIETADLSDGFWGAGLVRELDKSTINNPFMNIFFASQVYFNDEGFLSTDIKIKDMIEYRGDIHHLFPKDYIRKTFPSQSDYNQIANFVYLQQEINVKVSNKSPKQYFEEILNQIKTGDFKYGNLTSEESFYSNLEKHCIPKEIINMESGDYLDFLVSRRKLMAKKIEKYYKSL
jgi:hypothetical protein